MTGTTLAALLQAHDYAVVLSACHKHTTVNPVTKCMLNTRATSLLETAIARTGLKFLPVEGVYEGEHEDSFLVLCNDYYDVARMECFALHDNQQESVLVLDLQKECAILKYNDCASMIGHGLVQLDLEEADMTATYTKTLNYSVIDGEHWIVE